MTEAMKPQGTPFRYPPALTSTAAPSPSSLSEFPLPVSARTHARAKAPSSKTPEPPRPKLKTNQYEPKMPANATVLYPAEADATFDMSYYLKTHMPLVSEKWGPYGLKDWKVVQFAAAPDGSKPYSVAALLTWDSVESIHKALNSEEAKIVLGDVQNFSNKGPLFLPGDIVGTS
ncbi:hypothetical protein HRR75_003532 [Exophiala dermatitidis]|nr:hypothetical protein HRR75_003532 [Exophiala dermatitidis]